MSDRPCNLCDYRARQRAAKAKHEKLRVINDEGWAKVQYAEIGTNAWKDAGVLYFVLPDTCECCYDHHPPA